MKRNRLISLGCCLAVLPVGAVSAEATNEAEVYRATVGADGMQHVRMVGGSYFFRPQRIIVKVNMPVTLEASREPGVVPHSLVIAAPDAGMDIDQALSTDIKTVAFTPKAVGQYAFYCKNRLLFFKSHRQKGMEGILEVEE